MPSCLVIDDTGESCAGGLSEPALFVNILSTKVYLIILFILFKIKLDHGYFCRLVWQETRVTVGGVELQWPHENRLAEHDNRLRF